MVLGGLKFREFEEGLGSFRLWVVEFQACEFAGCIIWDCCGIHKSREGTSFGSLGLCIQGFWVHPPPRNGYHNKLLWV